MAMSQETRRRVVLVVAALIVVAMVLATTACSTTAGPGGTGRDGEGPAPLGGAFYPAAVTEVCADTDTMLAQLPTPGDGMSETDWAAEVSRMLEAEADALGDVGTISDVREDHRAFVTNTRDQAVQWSNLAVALATPDGEAIDAARTSILELSRGRIELAAELGIDGCRERSFR